MNNSRPEISWQKQEALASDKYSISTSNKNRDFDLQFAIKDAKCFLNFDVVLCVIRSIKQIRQFIIMCDFYSR